MFKAKTPKIKKTSRPAPVPFGHCEEHRDVAISQTIDKPTRPSSTRIYTRFTQIMIEMRTTNHRFVNREIRQPREKTQ